MITKCFKHPKYLGKGKPRGTCVECLNLYLRLHKKPRILIKPNKVEASKKTYTRKEKHKKETT